MSDDNEVKVCISCEVDPNIYECGLCRECYADAQAYESQRYEIERLQARVEALEGALKPFTHPDLRLRLGGNTIREGDSAIVFQRNAALLRLRDFDRAAATEQGDR